MGASVCHHNRGEVVNKVGIGCNPLGSRGCTGEGYTCNAKFSFKSSNDHRMTK